MFNTKRKLKISYLKLGQQGSKGQENGVKSEILLTATNGYAKL